MTRAPYGSEFDSDFDRLDRPYELPGDPALTDLSDLPAWKEPDMDQRMQYWEEDQPFATTGFTTPHYLQEDDWW